MFCYGFVNIGVVIKIASRKPFFVKIISLRPDYSEGSGQNDIIYGIFDNLRLEFVFHTTGIIYIWTAIIKSLMLSTKILDIENGIL
ncbi:MAG: hypothetical protein DRP93_01950 [Candidatus Neomarinimicrobiota bacterium]|nr:MAG: hypothetical protein DRP93_01950 [Candidatus Neomarinimicrobiota bacterium]